MGALFFRTRVKFLYVPAEPQFLEANARIRRAQVIHQALTNFRMGRILADGDRLRGAARRADATALVLDAYAQGRTLAELHASEGEQRLQLAQTVSRLFLRGKQS